MSRGRRAGEDTDVTPQYLHQKKLADEHHARAKKADPVEVKYRLVFSSHGKPKYQKESYMPNGNVFRVPVSKEEFEKKQTA